MTPAGLRAAILAGAVCLVFWAALVYALVAWHGAIVAAVFGS